MVKRSHWLVVTVAAMAVGACGDGADPASALPRTTDQGIEITVSESVETVYLPGCATIWMSRGEEPPPGACEETDTVLHFVAARGRDIVTASVVGEPAVDPLYAMQLVSHEYTDAVSVVVVIPPPAATSLRLVDSAGEVVDQVQATERLMALAGPGSDLTIEALAPDRSIIATCPPDGVTINNVTYLCTLAPGAIAPVTTTVTTTP